MANINFNGPNTVGAQAIGNGAQAHNTQQEQEQTKPVQPLNTTLPEQAQPAPSPQREQDTNTINFNGSNTAGAQAIGDGSQAYNTQQTPSQTQKETTNVLFVLSNPRKTNHLRLNTEMRAIEESLRLSKQREQILSHTLLAATVHDLRRAMLDRPYQIVHMAGHGTNNGFVLEDDQGLPHVIDLKALTMYFSNYRQSLRCVILNACDVLVIGQNISLGIPYAIAMSGPIDDRAAIEFSRGFYDAIGAGKDIERAYIEGMSAVRMAGKDYNFLAQLLRE